jgi:ATP-dependent RNA helicase DeaD
MPDEVAAIARDYMNDPFEIAVGRKNSGAENVEHIYHMVHAKDRYAALKRVMDFVPEVYGIVFCRTRHETKEVASQLILDGYSAEALHGDLSQAQRDYVMDKFRKRGVQMLVATDVAARGLDVSDLTHIINYDLPDDIDNYTHRSGRTGRAGKSGTSISIIHLKEQGRIRMIEKGLGKKFIRKPVPGGKEICEKQLMYLTDRLQEVSINEEQIEPFLQAVYEKLEHLSREELIKHFVSLEFNRFLEYYGNTPDLNNPESHEAGRRESRRESGRAVEGLASFRLNVGRASGISARDIIAFVNEATGRRNVEIGKIGLQQGYSTVEVDQNFSKELLNNSRGMHFHGTFFDVKEMKGITGERSGRDQGAGYRERNRVKSRESGGDGDFRRRNRKKRF